MLVDHRNFNDAFLEAIDLTFDSLGKSCAEGIYFHLRTAFHINKVEIPERVEEFDKAITSIFGDGAFYLEKMILRKLNEEFELNLGECNFANFVEFVNIIRTMIAKNTCSKIILERISPNNLSTFAERIWHNQLWIAQNISLEAFQIIEQAYQKQPSFFGGKTIKGIVGGLFYLLGFRHDGIRSQKEIGQCVGTTEMTIRCSYRNWLSNFPEIFPDINEKMLGRRERK
jgi:transcription initiation factor TFIIIB Brf1 subunit/transcription initiation factor TFIIB